MPDIITVGEILVEIMARNVGQEFTRPGEFIGPYPSGAPAIFIDQAARMGASAGIVARVGDDDFGLLNVERLKQDGVDISHIRITPGYTTGTAFVTYFKDGSRKFIFHLNHSAAGVLEPADVGEEYIKSARYLHIMGCSVSGGEGMRRAILKAVRIARENNVKISFDPNVRPELLGGKELRRVFDEIIDATDILLTGEGEAMLIAGLSSLEESIVALRNRKIETIIVKSGSKGADAYLSEGIFHIPPFKVEEVDPTGAGDCFDGAFIACLTQGLSVKDAALIANAAGALGVTKRGPMEGASMREDIVRLIHAEGRALEKRTMQIFGGGEV